MVALAIFTTWKSNILLGDDVVAIKAPDKAINEQSQGMLTIPAFSEGKRHCNEGNERMTVLLNEPLNEIGYQPKELTQTGLLNIIARHIVRA